MESYISGEIQYIQISDSRALRKFAHKQIKKWIQKRFPQQKSLSANYQVELKREGAGHTFNCQIKVKLGNQIWSGYNYKGSLHQALIRCLEQMSPMPAAAF